MTDFLNNLVARTLNLAPVVQPRLASRFEPVNPATATIAEESVEVEAPTQPVSTVRNETRSVEPAPVAPRVEHEQSRSDFQRIINTVRHTYVPQPEVPQPRVDTVQPHVPELPPKVSEHSHLVEKPSRIEPRVDTEKTDLKREVREEPRRTPLKEDESWRQVEPRVRSLIDSRLSNVAPVKVTERYDREVPVVTTPRSNTRVEPAPVVAAPRFEVPPALPAEPSETINVTIGRVDVRAVFSNQATPPPMQARSLPVNTLDDYLKQRSEGRR